MKYIAETKNRWARDDPAFAVIEMGFLLVPFLSNGNLNSDANAAVDRDNSMGNHIPNR